ncbi:putative serine peptidase, putative,serine peptidase, clan SC, family S9D [Trypanosoma theileri]|uniref:Putative serine peptidase, putative,serine peptidase, clan SC, family S9D n=1 Tax=Trypanosoma theileri TaxID=67003 RepID=A0A1X0P0Q0_9TRYP|nr:putative serine peptidase, putative,serine peptidase, clan SC, family S9D [Trypanosoma theileri]ORC90482.1 putative serine peptidase, putative,serine peptidase, clan SC, family S9D [Trypanosoma theileri]
MIKRFVFQPPGPLPSIDLMRRWNLMSIASEGEANIYYIHIRCPASAVTVAEREETLTILYSHGNAEDLGSCHEGLRLLSHAIGVDIIVYDYCGYGFSKAEGRCAPTEKSVYKDADVMYTELTERLHISPHRIILMGRSMGGGPACYLAQKHHSSIGGLILLSTFTSCLGAVRCSFLRYLFVKDMFPNKKFLKKVNDCPVLLLHGKKDEVVSFSCAEKLLKTVKKAQRVRKNESNVYHHWFDECKHNDIEIKSLDKLINVISLFTNSVSGYRSTREPVS